MLPRNPEPMRHRCPCGFALQWEARETYKDKRWLAFCLNSECGQITTQIADGPERIDGLADFLLGEIPPQPYVQPWVRFFLHAANAGLMWKQYPSACHSCGENFVMHLDLSRQGTRPADPDRVVPCLHCGQVALRLWALGNIGELHHASSAWNEAVTALRARSIIDRAAPDPQSEDDPSWDVDI